MKKQFNTTGLCIPTQHYMVDITERVAETKAMVDQGDYFTISRPRQYGKTTMLNCLRLALKEEYIVIDTSFEGIDDSLFETQENFASGILDKLADDVEFIAGPLALSLHKHQKDVANFNDLSRAIRNLVKEDDRKLVLLIDEVDKSSNSKVFLQFLGLLRNKYLAAKSGKDLTFQSVVLAGVHDIKNLKLAIRDEAEAINEKRFNSPWNVAVDYRIKMSFDAKDIETMLGEYSQGEGVSFDAPAVARRIREWTGGYPYLVSRICQKIEKEFGRDWTERGVDAAVKQILIEPNTLFDDLIKNIENNSRLKEAACEILFDGERIPYNYYAFEQGLLYGIFVEQGGRMAIHNRIFEEVLYQYLQAQSEIKRLASPISTLDSNQFTDTGQLDAERVLRKFREFMHQEYREEDGRFYEKNGRLLFLAYLRPIINGKGFSWVEAETRDNKRMDIVVTYGTQKFIIELKIWRGKEYERKGLRQLAEYLDIQNEETGWLITFGLGQMQDAESTWTEAESPAGKAKRIFSVVV